jgi:hypothetical protein
VTAAGNVGHKSTMKRKGHHNATYDRPVRLAPQQLEAKEELTKINMNTTTNAII